MSKMPPIRSGSSDIFQTPSWPVKFLLNYIPKDWIIWEPACGEGQKPWGGLNVDYSHDVVRRFVDCGNAYLPSRELRMSPTGCSAAYCAGEGEE